MLSKAMDTLGYCHLLPGEQPPSLGEVLPFKAVVVIEDAVSEEWQSLVSDWLVRSRCLYMMAWGRNCCSWDDSVDCASLAAFDFGDIPEEAAVMTTWHENDSLAETFWFAENCASHPTVNIGRTIIVHISAKERETDLLAAFRNAQVEDGYASRQSNHKRSS
jgi:hypothetical protein